jgi:hypothetical protein
MNGRWSSLSVRLNLVDDGISLWRFIIVSDVTSFKLPGFYHYFFAGFFFFAPIDFESVCIIS